MGNFVDHAIRRIREQVGNAKVICGLSGGVDSSVTAALLNRAIGKQLYMSSRAVERHVQAIFEKLRLPNNEDDNRRVLAVLAVLGH